MKPDTNRVQIAVVDDEPSVRRSIVRLLRAHNYRAESFGNVAELMESTIVNEIGCLVLDVRMPDIDGLELQRTLARSHVASGIVFMSGHSDVAASVTAMKHGAVDFLVKPVDEEELISAVERALSRARSQREREAELTNLRRNLDRLTPREREVCALVASGLPNKQIAARLGTTEKTIKVHRARAVTKLHATSLAQLVRIADRLELRPSALRSSRREDHATSSV